MDQLGRHQSLLHTFQITIDNTAGPFLINKLTLDTSWLPSVQAFPNPHLWGAYCVPLTVHGVLPMFIHHGNLSLQVWFCVIENSLLNVLMGSFFLHAHTGGLDSKV